MRSINPLNTRYTTLRDSGYDSSRAIPTKALRQIMTEIRRSELHYTAYMCGAMDAFLGNAMSNGDMKLGRFPLVIRAFGRAGQPVPKELADVRIEIEAVRLIYEKPPPSYCHSYARDAGIIIQPLEVAGIDISGWMVSLHEVGSELKAYLGRPTSLTRLRIEHGISMTTSDEEIEAYLRAETREGPVRYIQYKT